jgi:hypothetical protein
MFGGKFFVYLSVYADESGTHDITGRHLGSEAPVFGGYIGDREDWVKFLMHWGSVLKKYNVPYFHYSEFSKIKDARSNPNSHYYGWDDFKRDTFLFELAAVAGAQVPVGALIKLKGYVQQGKDDYPYKRAFGDFLENVHDVLSSHWPKTKERVTFHLDQNDDKEWMRCFGEVFDEWKQKDQRFSAYAFVDKKDPAHWGLQAADLICYRVRRRALARLETGEKQMAYLLDEILFRNDKLPRKKRDVKRLRDAAARAASQPYETKFGPR